MKIRTAVIFVIAMLALISPCLSELKTPAIDIGTRRELFIDRYLIDTLYNTELRLAEPVDRGPALKFDRPWEGCFAGYSTVIKDADRYRLYYRGLPVSGKDFTTREVTCYAESKDGIRWTKPALGLYEVSGTKENNVVYANDAPYSHNFSPMLDTRPDVKSDERYKALAGNQYSGLWAFVSPDGIHWRKLEKGPVLAPRDRTEFSSQNLAFWSELEGKYVCFFRTGKTIDGVEGRRWISRATSKDFRTWTDWTEMNYGDAPTEELYTNQTSPYYRAPHLYFGICSRFFYGRQVVSNEEGKKINIYDPHYNYGCADVVFISSRGGNRYDRTFMEGFLRPGLGNENWVSRSNHPALNVVETGPTEISFYIHRRYAQPAAYLQRVSLRIDGFASVHAPYGGGEMITKVIRFSGKKLEINYSTSAAGGIRVEIQDPSGVPVPGFALAQTPEIVGDEISHVLKWKGSADLSRLVGKPVRLRFVMKDADLYALQFRD